MEASTPTFLMDAYTPKSLSSSKFSPAIIGALVGVGVLVMVVIIVWVFIYCHGGLSKTLQFFRMQRGIKREAQDIESARVASSVRCDTGEADVEQKCGSAEHELALKQLQCLYSSNTLVGSTLTRPERVDIEQELCVEKAVPDHQKMAGKSQDTCRPQNLFQLAVDPMSWNFASGKSMAKMYSK
ncbi:hypothetical protein OPT61_g5316 [Boeremia exigua]|uniref:Uncharacterized protein n=1 Tax=Boeremia exigua TaxID=749465 RepID=A0ACC2IAX2_9PLEO|nr:hypothetical protein OPT61_g5316 [Boeremia exigua]